MKVLMISTVPVIKNGITNVILNLISNTKDPSISYGILAINHLDDYYRSVFRDLNVEVHEVSRTKSNILSNINRIVKIIRENQYDVCHIHGNSHTIAIELFAAWKAGCKVRIAHSHNTTCKEKALNWLLTPVFHWFYTDAMACGRDAGKWMFGKKPFVVLNNGVDVSKFQFNRENRDRVRDALGIGGDSVLLTNVGALNAQKNQAFLLGCVKELNQKQNRKYVLLLIGEGRLFDDLKQRAKEMDLGESVIFLGGTNAVHEYLSASDAIVMPSIYEGLPLALIEEQANGLKCFVSDVITREANLTGLVTYLDIANGVSGWVEAVERMSVHPDRTRDSAEAIAKLIDGGYSIEDEAKKLVKIYTESCGRA